MRRLPWVIGGVAASLLLWGCGERAQEMTTPSHGKYQGKTDSEPWNNAQWKNNKTEWESALKARNQNQNEYTRAP